jgi:putative transposase
MARQMRVDAAGLTHHVTSRGNDRRKIFLDDADCEFFLSLLAIVVKRFNWSLHAWVLMVNHFHLVVETHEPTLSLGMHWLKTGYAQYFNWRHRRGGHLFQGRFDSKVIQKEAYLMEVMRYVALNPVRAHMVERPEDYRWSSYRATAGYEPAPEWLDTRTILGMIRADRGEAQRVYREYVCEKIGDEESIWDRLQHQIFLGTEEWLEKMRALVEQHPRSDDHPLRQRGVGRPKVQRVVRTVAQVCDVPEAAIRFGRGGAARMVTAWLARYEGLERLRAIAAVLRLRSSGYVSDLVAACERELGRDPFLRALIDRCLALLRGRPTTIRSEDVAPLYWPMMPLPGLIREAPPPYLA